MTDDINAELNARNYKLITNFISAWKEDKDKLTANIMSTLAHFIGNMAVALRNHVSDEDIIFPVQLIDLQIQELRRCIVDLTQVKKSLIKGETFQ